MKFKSVFISLVWIVCTYSGQSMDKNDGIVIYEGFPKKSNTLVLEPTSFLFKDTLDRVIDLCRNKKQPSSWQQISFVTPQEAAASFYTYLEEKVGKEEAEKLASDFFSPTYFGSGYPSNKRVSDPIEDARKDPYLIDNIGNILIYSVTEDYALKEEISQLGDFNRYSLKTIFLTPEQIFNGFISHPFYGERCGAILGTKDFDEFKKIRPSLAAGLFCERLMGIPNSPEERKKHFLTKPIGFFSQDLIGRIYKVAQRMITSSKPEDTFVIFGNTPYFVGRALKKLVSCDPGGANSRKIIDFPFSGSPNRIRDILDPRNVVTPERLGHLKRRLAASGLSSTNSHMIERSTHFVDVISSGSGPAYVIEEILRDFMEAGKTSPHMDIYSVNQIKASDQEDPRNSSISFGDLEDGASGRLFFPRKETPHFSIMNHVFYLQGHTQLDMLPSDEWRVFPEYNAAYWLEEYDWMLTQEPAYHTQVLLDYFDTNVARIMEEEGL